MATQHAPAEQAAWPPTAAPTPAVAPVPAFMVTADLARVLGRSPSQARRWLNGEGRSIRVRIGRSWGCLGTSFVGLLRSREGVEPTPTSSPALLRSLAPRTSRGRRRGRA